VYSGCCRISFTPLAALAMVLLLIWFTFATGGFGFLVLKRVNTVSIPTWLLLLRFAETGCCYLPFPATRRRATCQRYQLLPRDAAPHCWQPSLPLDTCFVETALEIRCST